MGVSDCKAQRKKPHILSKQEDKSNDYQQRHNPGGTSSSTHSSSTLCTTFPVADCYCTVALLSGTLYMNNYSHFRFRHFGVPPFHRFSRLSHSEKTAYPVGEYVIFDFVPGNRSLSAVEEGW